MATGIRRTVAIVGMKATGLDLPMMALGGSDRAMKAINSTKAIGKATVAGLNITTIGTATETATIDVTATMTGAMIGTVTTMMTTGIVISSV